MIYSSVSRTVVPGPFVVQGLPLVERKQLQDYLYDQRKTSYSDWIPLNV